jgi:hypothetical protein
LFELGAHSRVSEVSAPRSCILGLNIRREKPLLSHVSKKKKFCCKYCYSDEKPYSAGSAERVGISLYCNYYSAAEPRISPKVALDQTFAGFTTGNIGFY